MVMVLSEGGQTPFEIVHLNTFAPTPKLDTLELACVGTAIVPAPLTNVHTPLPTTGKLLAKVALVEHTD
jgi:hypothetical protein